MVVQHTDTLHRYFPTDLVREINLAASIRPIIKYSGVDDGFYVLKSTGKVVYKGDNDRMILPLLHNSPSITYIDRGHDDLFMITSDAKVMQIDTTEEGRTLILVPQLEEHDITQITLYENVLYALTVDGQLYSFSRPRGRLLTHRDTSVVQIKNKLGLTSKGQVYDLEGVSSDIIKDTGFVVNILSNDNLLSLDGVHVKHLRWKVTLKQTDIVQHEMTEDWDLYLIKKGTIFLDKPDKIFPDLNNITSFTLTHSDLLTVDANDNIKITKYETKTAFFIESQTDDKLILIGHVD